MKHYKTMIDVEYDMNGIESYVRWKHDLESNWYGDCYPEDIRKIMMDMWCCKDEQEYKETQEYAEKMFDEYAKQVAEEGK